MAHHLIGMNAVFYWVRSNCTMETRLVWFYLLVAVWFFCQNYLMWLGDARDILI